jgi:hypothetical protein
MLGTLDPEKKQNWKSHINSLVHAYNCTKHNSTQYTPYFLMFGRHPRLPIDVLFGLKQNHPDKNTPDYIQNLKRRLKEAYELASIEMQKAQNHQKKNYDKKSRGAVIEIGDRVLVKIVKFNGKHKIADKWEKDPYVVVDQKNKDIPVYTVRQENVDGKERILHRNLLLPISSNPIPALRKSVKSCDKEINSENPKYSYEDTEMMKTSEISSESEFEIVYSSSDESIIDESIDESITKRPEHKAHKSKPEAKPPNPTVDKPTKTNKTKVPVPSVRKSLRKRRLPEKLRSGDYVMNLNTRKTPDWLERANYLKKVALDKDFVHMPTLASEALLKLVTGS